MRKTVNVEDMITRINERLAGWTKTADERRGLISAAHEILSMADAYDGFGYLTEDELSQKAHDCALYNMNETGTVIDVRPGVRSHGGERMQNGVDTWFEDTDETRIHFYIHRKLRKEA